MSVETSSQIVLRAELSELDRLRCWIEGLSELHQLPSRLAFHLDVCVTELVTNVIRYAYPGIRAPADAVTVHFIRHSTEVVIEIEDLGIGFDPLGYVPAQLPSSLDDAEVGGRGLLLVRKFAEALDYRREDGRNRLKLAFSVPTD